ncbi:MAG: hypothetical protein K2X29_07020, partial [Candidatus Obscuribacterales bacterium]|nr:hypothetical protein [Candidatus Obscuribacterales bacterium]
MRSRADMRNRRGVITIEFAIGSLLIIVITALAVDITLMMLAYEVNDRACRNACRAAAQQSTSLAAQDAANAILRQTGVDGVFLKTPKLVTGSTSVYQYEDFGGNPILAADNSPFVRVTTDMDVTVPFQLFFFGNAFGDIDSDGAHTTNDKWTFRKTYV